MTQVSKRPADHSKAERWGIQFVEKPGQGWVERGETGPALQMSSLGLTSIGNTQKRDSPEYGGQATGERPHSWRTPSGKSP